MVNEAFVTRYWPGEAGVGKSIRSGGAGEAEGPIYEVVGVLSDVRTRAGAASPPQIFLPLASGPWRDMEIMVRSDADISALAPALRELVRRIDPSLPITRISSVSRLAEDGRARPRFYTGLFAGFAWVALVLAVVGVYGTTSYSTRSRVREIGIRLALGARRDRVVAEMVARTGAAVALGVALGIAGGAMASRAMSDLLTYVTPGDLLAYVAVALGVLSAGIAAAWIPAGRASRLDPSVTLRDNG
jgi:hypothetical protein